MHSALICPEMTFSELSKKEVVNVCDGKILGSVCDVEFDMCGGCIRALILPGNGLFASVSPKNRVTVPWRDVERIGDDAILVKYFPRENGNKPPRKGKD